MVAVGRPVDAGLGGDDHDGVDEAVDLLHRVVEPLDVGGREVPLVRRGRDLVQGEEAEQVPVAAHRLAEGGQHLSPVRRHPLRLLADRAGNLLHACRRLGHAAPPALRLKDPYNARARTGDGLGQRRIRREPRAEPGHPQDAVHLREVRVREEKREAELDGVRLMPR